MSKPSRLARLARLVVAITLLAIGAYRLAPGPGRAAAAVGHGAGFSAVVDGFASWYGNYQMGELGIAWCIDHGIRAPDPALGYVPTIVDGLPASTRTALAWAYGRHGPAADAVGAAALMLAGHDLMGAQYPSGRLDVERLSEASLDGFGSHASAVLSRARAIKADALAHGHLRPPWHLELVAIGHRVGGHGIVSAIVRAGDLLVAGVEVTLRGEGVALSTAGGTTGADGAVHAGYVVPAGAHRFTAEAVVPDLTLQAFAPTVAPAQRVARPATQRLAAALDRPAAPTTTTTSTTSTTAGPSTTTTTAPPTTTTSTTAPPTTTSTTAVPTTTSTTAVPITTTSSTTSTTSSTSTTTTSTTVGPSTTATSTTVAAAPALPAPPPPPPPRSLPRTGVDPVSAAATGSGLVLLGAALRSSRRRRPA